MKIAIIGAGFSGLAAAWKLSKKHEVILLEKEEFVGGMASSYNVPWDGKGYMITKTYHHILEGDDTTVKFIKELGLFGKFHKKKVKQGFLYRDHIYGFSSPIEIIMFPISVIDKVRLAKFVILDSKHQDWDKLKGINAKDWVISRAGRNNFEVFFDQLIRNKFHTSAENISAPWLGIRFFKESSSFLKKFGWLEGGVNQLIEGLVEETMGNGGKIVTRASISKIEGGKKITYVDAEGVKELEVDLTISTIAPEALLKLTNGIPKDLENQLKMIKYLSCACGCFGLKRPFKGPYWLNVLDKDKPFTVIFNHSSLYEDSAPEGKSVIYISTYLMKDEPLWMMTEEEIAEIYINDMESILPGFRESVEWKRVYKVENAEAIYTVNFENPPISCGSLYFAGIYRIFPKIRNMASAMESGLEVAEKVEEDIHV